MKNDPIVGELLKLKRNGKILPEDIIEAAKPERSPLHSWFEWDDTLAAHAFRLHQARELIKTRVSVIEGYSEPMRLFVSLSDDRQDGGYREVVEVMKSPMLRERLLSDAMAELASFKSKYTHLRELAEVFKAIDSVQSKAGRELHGRTSKAVARQARSV